MDPADTKELPREMSAADVAEETKADVEAVTVEPHGPLNLTSSYKNYKITIAAYLLRRRLPAAAMVQEHGNSARARPRS